MMFEESLAIVGCFPWRYSGKRTLYSSFDLYKRPFIWCFLHNIKELLKHTFPDRRMCHYLLLSSKSTYENRSCGSGVSVAEDWEWKKTNYSVCAWHHVFHLPSWQACDAEKKERSHYTVLWIQKVSTVLKSRRFGLAMICVSHRKCMPDAVYNFQYFSLHSQSSQCYFHADHNIC